MQQTYNTSQKRAQPWNLNWTVNYGQKQVVRLTKSFITYGFEKKKSRSTFSVTHIVFSRYPAPNSTNKDNVVLKKDFNHNLLL